MAKPKKKIDLDQVEEMAAEFCTQEEIAYDMGFERTLFKRRDDVAEAFTKGKNAAKMSLRHIMFNAARAGDRSVMIFLAKNELGYRDNPQPTGDEGKSNGILESINDVLTRRKDEHD